MIVRAIIVSFVLTLSFSLIEEQTFRDFFRLTFDLDRDEKFNISDWIAYYKYIEPDIDVNGTHLR